MRIVDVKQTIRDGEAAAVITIELQDYEVQELINDAAADLERGASVGTTRLRLERYDILSAALKQARFVKAG
jgi:hypothetical protein